MLLVKRSDDRAFYPGVWDVVGGHCEACPFGGVCVSSTVLTRLVRRRSMERPSSVRVYQYWCARRTSTVTCSRL